MKEIMAIIRMNMINETKKALSEAGYSSITCRKVYGRGKKKVNYELIEELIDGKPIASKEILESISEAHRLIAKRLLLMVVGDEEVNEIVKIIIDVNKTGNMGDGKIFVSPILDVERVRTGERGEIAV